MIYAIGDSFTYGDELPSQDQAWPFLLSAKLNLPVINKGRPATGNTRIVKRAVNAVLGDAKLLILGWSDCLRQEFADDTGIYDIWAGRNFRAFQNTTHYRIDMIKYMTAHDVPEYYYVDWLRKIILIQNFCKVKNVPCVMFISCGANEWHQQFAHKHSKLLDEIDQTQFAHPMSDAVAEWTYGTPQGPGGHPLEDGHKIIADKIYEHIRNKCRIS